MKILILAGLSVARYHRFNPLELSSTIMKKIGFLLVLLSVLLGISVTSASDFKEPQQAVNAYITAVSTGSGAHVEIAYTADATIKFYDREDKYREYTRESFAKAVNTGNKWDAKIEITELLITGNVANATVEFTWGDSGEHGYVDYLNLIHSNGSWQITNKVAQYISRQ